MQRSPVTILRFAAVGGFVAVIYVVLYLTFLALGFTQVLANAVAFGLAVMLQYAGQAAFTFDRQLLDHGQILRFTVMIALGFATSALVTSLIASALNAPHWAAAVAVTVILPVQNYIFMTLWVFAAPYTQG